MKSLILLFLAPITWAQLTLSYSACQQGQTCSPTTSGGTPPYTYTLISGSTGSIVSGTGAYTAPSKVTPNNVYGGWQFSPNDMIWNQDISALPVDTRTNTNANGTIPCQGGSPVASGTNNSVWMGTLCPNKVGGTIGGEFLNPVLSSISTTALSFFYTPSANANFHIPPFPTRNTEQGMNYLGRQDNHTLMVLTDTGVYEEVYGFYPSTYQNPPPGGTGENCSPNPACNSQSGAKMTMSAYGLPNPATTASGMPMGPLQIKQSEIRSGSIKHAGLITMQDIDNATSAWPSTNNSGATPNPSRMPYGTRLRLKSTYSWPGYSSGCTTTACHNAVQTLLTWMQHYGFFVTDIGTSWQIEVDQDPDDPDTAAALTDILNVLVGSNPTAATMAAAFEVVDERSLQTDGNGNSGTCATCGQVYYDNTYVTPTYAIAKVTDNASNTATFQIPLVGVAMGSFPPTMLFQAGAACQQINTWVTGSSNTAFTAAISPSGATYGTITSGGMYCPPASASGRVVTVATMTSSADNTVSIAVPITILPGGAPLRINLGREGSDFVDAAAGGTGATWYAEELGPFTTAPTFFQNHYSSGSGDFGQTYTGSPLGTWQGSPNLNLPYSNATNYGDLFMDFYLANGTYTVTPWWGNRQTATNQFIVGLDSQGTPEGTSTSTPLAYDPITNTFPSYMDLYTLASNTQYAMVSVPFTVTVSNGHLQVVVRAQPPGPPFSNTCCTIDLLNPSDNGYGVNLAGIQIQPQQDASQVSGSVVTHSIIK